MTVARRGGARGVCQPAGRSLRLPGGRAVGWLAAENWHVTLLRPGSLGTRGSTRSLQAGHAHAAVSRSLTGRIVGTQLSTQAGAGATRGANVTGGVPCPFRAARTIR